jgi:hypothetical protein
MPHLDDPSDIVDGDSAVRDGEHGLGHPAGTILIIVSVVPHPPPAEPARPADPGRAAESGRAAEGRGGETRSGETRGGEGRDLWPRDFGRDGVSGLVSLDRARRARDVSRPGPADEVAAEDVLEDLLARIEGRPRGDGRARQRSGSQPPVPHPPTTS